MAIKEVSSTRPATAKQELAKRQAGYGADSFKLNPPAKMAVDSVTLKSTPKVVEVDEPNLFQRAGNAIGDAVGAVGEFVSEQVEELSDAVRSTLSWLGLSRILSAAADERASEERVEKKKKEAAIYDAAVYSAVATRNAEAAKAWQNSRN